MRTGIQRVKGLGRRRATGTHQHSLAYRTANDRRLGIGRNHQPGTHFRQSVYLFNVKHSTSANHRPFAKTLDRLPDTLLPVRGIKWNLNIAEPGIAQRGSVIVRFFWLNPPQNRDQFIFLHPLSSQSPVQMRARHHRRMPQCRPGKMP